MRKTTRDPNGAMFILRCSELNLTDEALGDMTVGMVYDLLTEKANDMEEYPIQGTQEDIRRFFQ